MHLVGSKFLARIVEGWIVNLVASANGIVQKPPTCIFALRTVCFTSGIIHFVTAIFIFFLIYRCILNVHVYYFIYFSFNSRWRIFTSSSGSYTIPLSQKRTTGGGGVVWNNRLVVSIRFKYYQAWILDILCSI